MIPTQTEQSQRACILIVEDDNLQQEILELALTRHGYRVEVASDGLDAVRKVHEGKFDLALIDYNLPEIAGLATAKLIRYLMGEAARPALLGLTASLDRLTDGTAELNGGFDGMLAKPIRLPDLIAAIECCLSAAPNSAIRRAAEDALFQKRWAEYDAALEQPVTQNSQSKPLRILIVEDDDQQKLLLRSALESGGYLTETVDNGIEAIRAVSTGIFDLVLVDYKLPEIDGLATARLILDLMSEDARPRILALTSAPDHLSKRQTDSGNAFDEIVPKSSGLPALLATVARHLRSAPKSATRLAAEVLCPPVSDGMEDL